LAGGRDGRRARLKLGGKRAYGAHEIAGATLATDALTQPATTSASVKTISRRAGGIVAAGGGGVASLRRKSGG